MASSEKEVKNLPVEIWIRILNYLDVKSLKQLSMVSTTFHTLANDSVVWILKLRKSLLMRSVTNNFEVWRQSSPASKSVSVKDLYRAERQWIHGHFKDNVMFRYKRKFIPRLQQCTKYLWVGCGGQITANLRHPTSTPPNRHQRQQQPVYSITEPHRSGAPTNAEVSAFIITSTHRVISVTASWLSGESSRASTVSVYQLPAEESSRQPHLLCDTETVWEDIQCASGAACVGGSQDAFVTGSRCGRVRVWRAEPHGVTGQPLTTLSDRVWCVDMCSDQWSVACGTAALTRHPAVTPVYILDMNTGSVVYRCGDVGGRASRPGAGILDIKYTSPHTLLAGGYEANTYLYDTRTMTSGGVGGAALAMCDPDGNHIYQVCPTGCDQWSGSGGSGHTSTFLTGAAYYGVVRLWDIRRNKQPVQSYYIGSNVSRRRGSSSSSPIYSLLYNPTHMYVARYMSIHQVSFTSSPPT